MVTGREMNLLLGGILLKIEERDTALYAQREASHQESRASILDDWQTAFVCRFMRFPPVFVAIEIGTHT